MKHLFSLFAMSGLDQYQINIFHLHFVEDTGILTVCRRHHQAQLDSYFVRFAYIVIVVNISPETW